MRSADLSRIDAQISMAFSKSRIVSLRGGRSLPDEAISIPLEIASGWEEHPALAMTRNVAVVKEL